MMIQPMVIIVCWTSVRSRLLTGRTCRGANGLVCCAGTWFNEASNICEECPTGYIGFNCSKQCHYPSYGDDCQHDCTCDVQFCHHAHGCVEIKQSTPLQHDWLTTSSSKVLFHSTKHASLGTETNVTGAYSTNKASVDTVTTSEIIYIGIILIGFFVLFFGIFVATYVYQKCFRQRENMANLPENNIIDQLVQYKTLNFVNGEQEAVLNESRSRLNTDTTYLYPVFERNTSNEEASNIPVTRTRDQDSLRSNCEPQQHVYVEILDDNNTQIDGYENIDGNGVGVNQRDQDSLRSNDEPQQHVYVEILGDNNVYLDGYENIDGNEVDVEDPKR